RPILKAVTNHSQVGAPHAYKLPPQLGTETPLFLHAITCNDPHQRYEQMANTFSGTRAKNDAAGRTRAPGRSCPDAKQVRMKAFGKQETRSDSKPGSPQAGVPARQLFV